MATGTIQKDMVKLWENSNKATSFSAQHVALDLSPYKFVYVVAGYGTTSQHETVNIIPVTGVAGSLEIIFNLSGTTAYMAQRNFVASASGVTFNSAYRHSFGSTTAPSYDNGNCIPHYIYGIKDWIFGDSPISLN